jgi:hypothetical protein
VRLSPIEGSTDRRGLPSSTPGQYVSDGKYRLDPDIDRQIRHLCALPVRRAVEIAGQDDETEGKRVPEEALVALARRFSREGNDREAWEVVTLIARRIKGRMAVHLRRWRLDGPGMRSRIIEETLDVLYDAWLDVSSGTDFWVARFWVAFDRKMVSQMRHYRTELDRQSPFTVEDQFDEPEAGRDVGTSAAGTLDTKDPLTRALIEDALAALPEQIRTAFLLKHLGGMIEESKVGSGEQSIADVLGVSGRTVRNYLTRAELLLAKWRGSS